MAVTFLPVPHTCRLTPDLTVTHQRLTWRHASDQDLRRAPELERILDQAEVEDFTVAADHPAPEVAKTVASKAGWL